MCNEHFDGARARILMKNIAYVGVIAALTNLDLEVIKGLLEETFAEKTHLIAANMEAIHLGYDYAIENFSGPPPPPVEKMDATRRHIVIDGNTASALGCVYAGATVGAWYPITPSTSLMDAFRAFCAKYRIDPESGKRTYAIIQAEAGFDADDTLAPGAGPDDLDGGLGVDGPSAQGEGVDTPHHLGDTEGGHIPEVAALADRRGPARDHPPVYA